MRTNVLKNIVWSVAERISSQVIYFIVSILLARAIDPTEYGVVTTISVIVNIFGGAIQSGFCSALIYKKDISDDDYSTAFWCTLIMCSVFYLILFTLAPYVSTFYHSPQITLYMRVMSVQIIIQGIHSIPFAYVSKKMQFKKNYMATIIGIITSSVISILLIYMKVGIWALILISSIEIFVATIVLFATIKFNFAFRINIKEAKSMFVYCWKLMGVDILNSAYSNINTMIIGKKYSTADVAYYNRAYSLPQTILGSANTAVAKVLFPAFAESEDKKNILANLRKSIKTINYVVFPMLVGLLVISEELVLVLYTEKWIDTVPYLKIMCLIWMFQPVQICEIQAFKAIGWSNGYFKLEIFKKIISITLLVIAVAVFDTPIALAYTLGIGQIISTIMNAPSLKEMLYYEYDMQIKDVLSSAGICILMGIITWISGLMVGDMMLRLAIRIIVGIISYISLSVYTHNEQLLLLLGLIRKKGFQSDEK